VRGVDMSYCVQASNAKGDFKIQMVSQGSEADILHSALWNAEDKNGDKKWSTVRTTTVEKAS